MIVGWAWYGKGTLWRARAAPLRGVDPGLAALPEETTICSFRHLLEANDLGDATLEGVNRHLTSRGRGGRHDRYQRL